MSAPPPAVDAAALAQYQLFAANLSSHPRFPDAMQEIVGNPHAFAADDFDAKAFLIGKGFELPPGATVEIALPGPTDAPGNVNISVCVVIGGHVGCIHFQPPIFIEL